LLAYLYEKKFAFSCDFRSQIITARDFKEYGAFIKGVYSAQDLKHLLAGQDPDNLENWSKHMDSLAGAGYLLFGVFHKDKIVASAAICFSSSGDAVFTGAMRKEEYKGYGLGDQLHDVRKRHLASIGYTARIKTHIIPSNSDSIAAVIRNGFVEDGRDQEGSLIFSCDL